MPARPRSANSEQGIQGDELENDRIQLEQNLQQTDISLHLSSAHEDDDYSDVEYPRHNSGPGGFDGFASFDHQSRDHFDPADEHSQYNGWSYRTMEDDEGINPYEGRTMSTAAHHASALTLSAGLGGRGARRDVSFSGAEYDPDRPLQGIIAGFGTRIPGLDADSTKSKQFVSMVDFDPLVVDDSAEIERVLSTSRPAAPIPEFRSSSSTSSSSRPSTPMSPRPKLSDTLHHIAFSPKRPRNGQTQAVTRAAASQPRSKATLAHQSPRHPRRSSGVTRASVVAVVDEDEDDVATPRSRGKGNNSYSRIYQQSLSYVAPVEPEVNVFPPTPTESDRIPSKFTKMARGLAKEIHAERNRPSAEEDRPAFAHSTVREKNRTRTDSNKVPLRSVLTDLQEQPVQALPVRTSRTPMRAKVYLPDVTGLTNIVASPAKKLGQDYLGYELKDDELDVRLATALNVIQSKLAYLESEHSVSRRRVRELELELEDCKHQVAKERTRVLQRERTINQQQEEQKRAARSKHARVAEVEEDDGDVSRYKEAVEEKKALENLISTLRSHLSRLTTELSDHHKLLQELRTLRDSDARALKEKGRDIDQLRQEVERLGGEVEVLRGVVDEGLKERREARERSREVDDQSDDLSREQPQVESEDEADNRSLSQESIIQPKPIRARRETMDTDRATAGSPRPKSSAQPFVTPEEFDRIAEEVAERRSERSASAVMEGSSRNSCEQRSLNTPSLDAGNNHSDTESSIEAAPPVKRTGRSSPVRHAETKKSTRPNVRPPSRNGADAPFPQIRGEYMERLFFSAPEHNAKTCTVCHRRERAKGGRTTTATYHRMGHRQYHDDDDDEGFAEGEEDLRAAGLGRNRKGKERARDDQDDRLPPQTVLARVLRELEDDFTHYKSIYVELADQYKEIDAVSNVAKRNVLAEHLREVIDILEQKGDHIASLYDLLTYQDKPVQESAVPDKAGCTGSAWSTAPQVGSVWSRAQTRRR